ISANGTGLDLAGSAATANTVAGNFIGTDAAGTASLGNVGNGVQISGPGNTLGGSTAAARNIISANGTIGVYVAGANATGNLVTGNFIGTDATGSFGRANANQGVLVTADHNTIGTYSNVGSGNLISGNGSIGIDLSGSSATANVVT